MITDYYSVLSLPRNATERQIRERFRQLARERHPDRFQGPEKRQAEVDFQSLTEAFNVLTDDDRRRVYDEELARPAHQQRDAGRAARVFVQRGAKAYRAKDYLEAAQSFERATQEDPQLGQAWHYLARACSHNRRWLGRAVTAIAEACSLEPTNADYHKLAGQLYARTGAVYKAERHYKEALDWGGEDEEVLQALKELELSDRQGGRS